MKIKDVIAALAALAQETRLAIFRALVQQGPEGLAAGALADKLGVANATLSFHLKELSHAGLIGARQEGRFIYYTANYDTMNNVLGYLTENCCQGADCGVGCSPPAQRKRRTS
jgi:ArsR family transcriptional regulator, arsenate/arsenite/antimonite-responsive transcriptional repressor